jgi:hypothetical protein
VEESPAERGRQGIHEDIEGRQKRGVSVRQRKLWTDAIRKRDAWVSGIVAGALIGAALIAWLVRG